jgi:hypothetical protein
VSSYETVDRIRRSHRSARPNPAANPAWANCHLDCGLLLERISKLEAALADIHQSIWTDNHGIERIDVGCIKEALDLDGAP